MTKIKEEANPYKNIARLVSGANEIIIGNQHISHTLLSRLCDQKDEQKIREIDLLDAITKLTNRIERRDKTGLKFSLVMAMIAFAAFSIDLVRFGDLIDWESVKLLLSGYSCF